MTLGCGSPMVTMRRHQHQANMPSARKTFGMWSPEKGAAEIATRTRNGTGSEIDAIGGQRSETLRRIGFQARKKDLQDK